MAGLLPLQALIPIFGQQDLVAVFDQNFNQVFSAARAIKAVVKEDSKTMEHPIENGGTITDHIVYLPIEIELSVILQALDYPDTYKAIKQFFLNATLLVVHCKSGIYNNMLISSMPHEEDPEQYDALALALKLKQVQFVTTAYSVVPKKASNSNIASRGTQSPQPAQSTVAQDIFGTKRLRA